LLPPDRRELLDGPVDEALAVKSLVERAPGRVLFQKALVSFVAQKSE
jgi:hypothetical protein